MKNLRFHVLIIIALGYSLVMFGQGKDRQGIFLKRHYANVTTTQPDTLFNRTTHGRSASTTAAQKTALAALRTWNITGLGKDTSRVYKSNQFMTFKTIGRDTSSGGDSVSLELKIYMANTTDTTTLGYPPFAEFTLIDSTTITSDSTKTNYVFTSSGSNRPNYDWFYTTLEGQAANKKLSAVQADIQYSGFDPTK